MGWSDIVAEHFDAGVRFGSRVADGMVAVRIGEDVKMAVVATPEIFPAAWNSPDSKRSRPASMYWF